MKYSLHLAGQIITILIFSIKALASDNLCPVNNYTIDWTSTIISVTTEQTLSDYHITGKIANSNNAVINAGVLLTINLPSGTNANTVTSITINNNGGGPVVVIPASKTATQITFNNPSQIIKNATFEIIFYNVTNPSAGSYTGTSLQMTCTNASTGTNTFTNCNYSVSTNCVIPWKSIAASPSTESVYATYILTSDEICQSGAGIGYNAITAGTLITIDFPAGTDASAISSGTYNGSAITILTHTATQITFNAPTEIAQGDSCIIVLNNILNPTTGTHSGLIFTSTNNSPSGSTGYTIFNTLNLETTVFQTKQFNNSTGTNLILSGEAVLNIPGYLVNNGIMQTKYPSTDSDTIHFNGKNEQQILGSGTTQFCHFKINNQAGVKLLKNVSVRGQLLLTEGPLILNSKAITIENQDTGAITRKNGGTGYIISETLDNGSSLSTATPNNPCNSRVNWNISTASSGEYTIPFATNAGTVIPFIFQITNSGTESSKAGNGNLSIGTYPTSASNYPYPGGPSNVTSMYSRAENPDNSVNSVNRFWIAEFNNYSINPTLTIAFSYDAANDLNGLNPAELKAEMYNGTFWDTTQIRGTGIAPNMVTGVTGVNSPAQWVVMKDINTLPVELKYFNVLCQNNQIEISWATASETNNSYFIVEKSDDTENWEGLSTIGGMGNSSVQTEYYFEDNNTSGGIHYYRLKQVDYNGNITYSEACASSCHKHNQGNINIFPNPAKDKLYCNIYSPHATIAKISIINMLGKSVYTNNYELEKGNNSISIDIKEIVPANYNISIISDDLQLNLNKQIIIKK